MLDVAPVCFIHEFVKCAKSVTGSNLKELWQQKAGPAKFQDLINLDKCQELKQLFD